jgi:hypothetical protein
MRWRLADSLAHIAERSSGSLAFDEVALSRLVAQLKAQHRFPPSTFALYYDLVDSLLKNSRCDAEPIFAELCQQTPVNSACEIISLDPAAIGAAALNRYRRLVDTDEVRRFQFTTPSPQLVRNFPKECKDAIAMMARAAPELSGEFSGLVCQIILAAGDFAGASSFQLWGALFINPEADHSIVSLIETLAHESAHSLLFGLMLDDCFVLNPDEERFESPLRHDLRPMDGIYHATFVVARMHYAMERLLASGLLDVADTKVAEAAMQRHRQAFTEGIATLNQNGRLTTHGTAIMASAADYMPNGAFSTCLL